MIYYKVEQDWETKYIKKAQEITMTDFEFKNGMISMDSIWSIIEELVDIIEHEREEKEEEIQKMYEKEKWEGYEYGE